jgi:hypothetical protein
MNEADTCRTYVVPKLQAAGWEDEPHSIAEQRYFTDGRIVVRGNSALRKKGKKADYLLRYSRDYPLAVVEAKSDYKSLMTAFSRPRITRKRSISNSPIPPTARASLSLILVPARNPTLMPSRGQMPFGCD